MPTAPTKIRSEQQNNNINQFSTQLQITIKTKVVKFNCMYVYRHENCCIKVCLKFINILIVVSLYAKFNVLNTYTSEYTGKYLK